MHLIDTDPNISDPNISQPLESAWLRRQRQGLLSPSVDGQRVISERE
jgi:hypothetical protein